MKRLFWQCAYPVCLLCHKLFGLSYLWVNVDIAAWYPKYFDPLWHHEWFGDEIKRLPDYIILCGIGYRTSVSDGLVQFICDDGMSNNRLRFDRDPHDSYGFLWYCDGVGRVPAPHWDCAYRWVKAVYGGPHELKRPAKELPQ